MDLVKEELENSMKDDGKTNKEESASDDENEHKDPTPQPIGSLMKRQRDEEEDPQ